MIRASLHLAGLVVSTLLLASALAQSPAAPPPLQAPVPHAILTAKRIFIANAGADSGLFPHPFTGNPDRAYSQLYADLSSAGHFALVDDPSNSDLVLELRLTAPYGPKDPDKQKGTSDPLPMFRLAIYDTKSHFLLWAVTEAIDPANLQKTHDRNFDDALKALLDDFLSLTGKAPNVPPR